MLIILLKQVNFRGLHCSLCWLPQSNS